MKEFVFRVNYFGLGDHLFYSHLPRIAKQVHKYKKVFISKYSAFGDRQIKELVWDMNPFFDDISSKQIPKLFTENVTKEENILDRAMLKYGLDDGLRFHEPEIYYMSKIIPELKDAVIFDPNFRTDVGHPSVDMIQTYFKQHNIQITHEMKLRENNRTINCKRKITTKNLKHFCDIIVSCKSMVCFQTGTAPLAAALRKSVTVLHTEDGLSIFEHSKLHNYITLKKNKT